MSKHRLTIHLTIEVPDSESHDETVDALETTVNDMLDDGTLQDWILDAAADHDDFDDDTKCTKAMCLIDEETEAVEPIE